jgi:hypothetical protein
MKYLLVNHVPFGRTTNTGAYEVGDMWLEDLRSECRAIRPGWSRQRPARYGRLAGKAGSGRGTAGRRAC